MHSSMVQAMSFFSFCPRHDYLVKAYSAIGTGQTVLLTAVASLESHLGAVVVRVGVSQRRRFVIPENKMSHMPRQGCFYRTGVALYAL